MECYGNTIILSPGFWRRTPTTSSIEICTWPEACIGGGGTGDELCGAGYTGVMCHVCSENFFFNSDTLSCYSCDGADIWTPSFIVFIFIAAIFTPGLLVYVYYACFSSSKSTGSSYFGRNKRLRRFKVRVKKFYAKYSDIIFGFTKVIVTTFQIVAVW